MSLDIFDIKLNTNNICVINLMTSPPEMAVCPLCLYGFLNVCPFDCTIFAGRGEVEPYILRLTT